MQFSAISRSSRARRRRPPIFLLLFSMLLLLAILPAAAEGQTNYVDGANGTDAGDCKDPAAPCKTISYAVGESHDGDEILITGGDYIENVKLKDGLARTMRGGYAYDSGAWTQDSEQPTVIDGNDADTTIEVRDHTNTVFEMITVTGGKGPDDPTFGNGCGGFKIQNSDVEIIKANIEFNSAGSGDGGALCAAGDDGKINLSIADTIIAGNRAGALAGALSLFNTNTTIVNALIVANKAESNIANVMLLNMDDQVTMINSTVAYNNPTGDQAIHIFDGEITIRNSIMWTNALNLQADPPCPECFDLAYSNIQGFAGGTVIDEEPLFVDSGSFNYQLQWDSPCVNSGTPTGAPPYDILGVMRDDMPDMGAYEFVPRQVYLPVVLAGD